MRSSLKGAADLSVSERDGTAFRDPVNSRPQERAWEPYMNKEKVSITRSVAEPFEPLKANSSRSEICTVVLRLEDYAELKKVGGPRTDQIHMALQYYLRMIKDGRGSPAPRGKNLFRGNVVNFQCALSKDLCREVRQLGGRFDSHTIEAIRLFLL